MRYGDLFRNADGVLNPEDDRRAAYTNARWPWIVAIHRFIIESHQPHSADTAFFRFPPGTDPGRYVIHYLWRGYRDCIDVDVLPLSKPVNMTFRSMFGYRPAHALDDYVKTDHCQYASHASWPVANDGTTCAGGQVQPAGTGTCFAIPPEGQRNSLGQTNEQALQSCKDRCSSASSNYNTFNGQVVRGYCSALNIVPLTAPPDLAFPNEQNIPWGVGGCTRGCFANEPAGSSICYGLREMGSRAVEAPWDIVRDDPRDETFYSTCYRRAPPRECATNFLICGFLSNIGLTILYRAESVILPHAGTLVTSSYTSVILSVPAIYIVSSLI